MNNYYCDGKVIRDSLGRQRIFKGINICIKSKKQISARKLEKEICNQKYIDSLKTQGFNLIRLGITWDLIEPNENEYSTAYINVFKSFVSLCRDNDICIMLDMHQDLFSLYLCHHGDGAPKWAVTDYKHGVKPLAVWSEGYFYMDHVQQAFYDFWMNKNSVQDKFAKMWQFYVKQFDGFDNIIGYDYLNEPFVHQNGRKIFLSLVQNTVNLVFGEKLDLEQCFSNCSNRLGFVKMILKIAIVVKSIKQLKHLAKVMDSKENFLTIIDSLEQYTNDFNEKYYQHFYDNMCLSTNPTGDRFNIFEHNYYSNLGIPFTIECDSNSIYSPHAYDVFIDSPLYNKYSSNNRVEAIIDSISINQDKMNVPVIFGEWGGGAKGKEWINHIDYVYNLMEKHQWSNVYWNFDFDNKELCRRLNRPYPVAINGNIIEYSSDSKTKTFVLKWNQSQSNSDNLIYIPHKGIISVKGTVGENTFTTEY